MAKRLVLLAALAALAAGAGGCTVMESTYLKKVNEADALAKELATLQQKYKDLSFENATLRARATNLSMDLEKMTGERDKLSAERDRLSADLGYMTGQRDKLTADNKDLENVLKSKSDSLSQTIMDLRQKIGVLENENGRLRQEVAAKEKALGEKDKKAAGLEADKAKLQQDLAGLQKTQEEKVEKVSKTYEDLLQKMKGEISQGQVTISELKGKLTVNMVDAILFDSGKAEVKAEGQVILQKVVSILKDVKDKAIRVEGHTDNVQIIGMLAKRYATNWELSAARAINVARYLQDQGINPAVLSAVAYGEYKPVAANDTPEGKQKNRRIEIILVPKE